MEYRKFLVGLLLCVLSACDRTQDPHADLDLNTLECSLCHLENYNEVTDPVHAGVFSTNCTDCHNTSGWRSGGGGAHPEDRFPITTGDHSNYQCTDCHNESLGAYTGGENTDCVGCHVGEHTRAKMDAEHGDVGGYPSGDAPPNFCRNCHPAGR